MTSRRVFGAGLLAWAVCVGGCTGLLGDFTIGGDAGTAEAGSSEASTSDVGTSDVGTSDVAASDVAAGDVASADTGHGDAAAPDAAPADAGTTDARDGAVEGGCGAGQLACDGGCVSASDPHHCGACGRDCLGGTCAGAVCQSFTITAGGPWFATDGVDVVWVTASDAFQAPVAGGPAITLYSATSSCALGIYAGDVAIAGGRVAWTGSCTGSLATVLWSAAAGLANSGAIGPPTGNGVYFQLTLNPAGSSALLAGEISTSASGVLSCPFGGSCAQLLTSSALTPNGAHSNVIAASGGDVVWTDENASVFASVSGTQSTMASAQPGPKSVTTDGTYVYWANRGTPSGISRTSIAAPATPATVLAGVSATWISTDGTNVYFTDGTTDVKYVPIAGGPAQSLYSGASPAEVVTAAGGVFWSDRGNIQGIRFP